MSEFFGEPAAKVQAPQGGYWTVRATVKVTWLESGSM